MEKKYIKKDVKKLQKDLVVKKICRIFANAMRDYS